MHYYASIAVLALSLLTGLEIGFDCCPCSPGSAYSEVTTFDASS